MMPGAPLRFLIVLIVGVAVGTGALLLVFGGETVTPRKGIRIATVPGRDDSQNSEAPLPGLPTVRRSEGAEYSSYQTVTFPGEGDAPGESFEYLAAYLQLETAQPMDLKAEGVTCLIFRVPATIEEARALSKSASDPSVSIRAGKAKLSQGFSETVDTGGQASVWELTLSVDVIVTSKEKALPAVLTAEILEVRPEEQQISAAKRFRLESEGYTVEGVGLAGHAGLGTFSVEKEIVVTLPTAAVLPGLAAEDATTQITCAGPLLVERLGTGKEEPGEWIPSRVEFTNSVRVVQKGPDGVDRIFADRLIVELFVRQLPEGTTDPNAETARVRELTASGRVELIGAAGTRLSARKLIVVPGDEEDRIELTGPCSFEHRGVLEEGGPEGIVSLRAGGDGLIRVRRDDGSVTARFEGGVSARRLDEKKSPLLTIDADRLTFRGSTEGREMIANGGARFETSGVSGRAQRIVWNQFSETHSEIRLVTDAVARAEAGANLDPFAATAQATEENEDDTVVVLKARGSIHLDSKGPRHIFRMTESAVIRRITGETERTRVTADRIEVIAEVEPPEPGVVDPNPEPAAGAIVVREITATGHVVAIGRPVQTTESSENGDPVETEMDVQAAGDHFHYDTGSGRAVLTGEPAEARLREAGNEWNRIAARRLSFGIDLAGKSDPEGPASPGALLAETSVSARVHLATKKGAKPEPFALTSGRLEIRLKPEPESDAAPVDNSPEGRIEKLIATENVVLTASDWVARGDQMTYSGGSGQDIRLRGTPAKMERAQTLFGRKFVDSFTADEMQIRLQGQRLLSFHSPGGGDLVLHRSAGDEGPLSMGGGGDEDKPAKNQVERVTAHGAGAIAYDSEKKLVRIEEETWLEQALETPDGFRPVAKFRADLVQAWLETDADGIDIVTRAEGRGSVEGNGEGWTLTCDSFEVDLKNRRTIIVGSPARVVVNKAVNVVERAVYEYEKDSWEFSRITIR